MTGKEKSPRSRTGTAEGTPSRSGQKACAQRSGPRPWLLGGWIGLALCALWLCPGCRLPDKAAAKNCVPCPNEDLTPALQGPHQLTPEDPCLKDCGEDAREVQAPSDFLDYSQVTYLDLTLEACVASALQNSKVMRDLGVSILRAPNTNISVFDPSIVYTDPRQGEEAALSAFDANMFASAMYEKVDKAANNRFLGNLGLLQQDLQTYRAGIQKTTASGTNLRLQNVVVRDLNNQQGNFFPPPSSTWDDFIDTEIRQPLLQGFGTTFNRIAGPNATPGVYNGVLLGRSETDMSLARFEQGIQEYLCNVENAYWDLYFAYRDLEAKIDARNEALDTWRKIASQAGGAEGSRTGAEAQQIAQAEEQYFRFEAEVVDALNGRVIDGTRTNNGSTGGTFRANSGVRVAERRLRLIMGLPINGSQLIRPSDVPVDASVKFDWDESVDSSIRNRPELRHQRWNIKRVELEYIASKNFLLPRLDFIGRYRFRGFGKDLLGSDLDFSENPQQSSAVADLLSGRRQEWQMGAELLVPIGYRQEFAAVRNAELRLARERALLHEQERDIMLGLSNAVAEVERAYDAKLAALNRLKSAEKLRDALEAVVDLQNAAPLDVKLEAQRRVADSKIQYYRTQVEYMLAIKNVHLERATLLGYYNVQLAESASDPAAYLDAERRDQLRRKPLNYTHRDPIVARGGLDPAALANTLGTTNVSAIPAPSSETPLPNSPAALEPATPGTTESAAEPAAIAPSETTPADTVSPQTPLPSAAALFAPESAATLPPILQRQ